VLVHHGRAAGEGDAVVTKIESDGARASAVAADLATAEGPQKLAFDVRCIVADRLDVLVANAGISKLALVEKMTIQDFDSLFAVNGSDSCSREQPLSLCGHQGCCRYLGQSDIRPSRPTRHSRK